jgi:hypothetical protein
MGRTRDTSKLVTTPSSAYSIYDEIIVSSASPSSTTNIWIDNTTASAPSIKTFSNNQWYGINLQDLNVVMVDYIIIAGGGGGGAGYSGGGGGGGGGAGGYRSSISNESSGGGGLPENTFQAISNSSYSITIGAGGAGAIYNGNLAVLGTNGNSSTAFGITSVGGGGGGGQDTNGISGGSGGGAGGFGGAPKQTGGSGTTNQGYAGGGGTDVYGGAGGGAGGAASTITAGLGIASSVTGSSVTRAIGGAYQNSTAGTANTGNGGSGSRTTSNSGNGGSGIVIIKFPDSRNVTISAGLTSTNTSLGGFKIYTFTAGTGTVTFS